MRYIGTFLDRHKPEADWEQALRFALWMHKVINRGIAPAEAVETAPDHLLLYLYAKKKEEQAA